MDRPMSCVVVGEQNFRRLRGENGFYVDKTLLLDDLLCNGCSGNYLITRPRRFGKTLALSMIDAFLNVDYKGNDWFDGLSISNRHEYDQYRNAFPVVSVTFNDLYCKTYGDFLDAFRDLIENLFMRYMYLEDSVELGEKGRAKYNRLASDGLSEVELVKALSNLVHLLSIHHGSRVVVLIDEYDYPMNEFYGREGFDDVRRFFKTMLSSVLKSNDDVQIAVVTGVMQIAKESVFSGLNNLKVNNVLTDGASERYGFTNGEVERICSYYGHPEKYPEAKEWYDGYRFGDSEVYNPWSVLNYVNRGFRPEGYWAESGSNNLVSRLLGNLDLQGISELRGIAEGRSIEVDIDTSVAFGDLTVDRNALYSVMVMSGYLNAVPSGDSYKISIPNKEVFRVFSRNLMKRFSNCGTQANNFLYSVLHDDPEAMAESLGGMLSDSVSGRILGDEHSYQSFILGMLMYLSGNYRVTGDYESGDGYHDIRIECIRGGTPHVVMEIKKMSDGGHDPKRMAEEALEQIHRKRYCHGLKGKVYLYGVAFDGKTPVVQSQVLEQ